MRVLLFTFLFAALSTNLFATQDKKTLKIQLQAQGGNLDQTIVYFDQSIQPAYNFQEDAQKVFSGVAGKPELFSVSSDNIQLSNNGFGTLSNTEVVTLGFDVDATGTYIISAAQIDNFDPTSIVRLEDAQAGTFTDLRSSSLQVMLNDNDAPTGRFFIHVTRPSVFGEVNAGCQNNDGKVTADIDNSIQWTLINLYDAFNNQVGSMTNVNGQFDFNNLAEGDYHMVMAVGNYTTSKDFHINGNYVVADITASALVAETWEEISFFSNATNSNQFAWDFGDGTLITGVANPSLSYLSPGIYNVSMIASNQFGCSDNASISVTISEKTTGVKEVKEEAATITSWGKEVQIKLNDNVAADAQINIYNLLGQNVYNSSSVEQNSKINLASEQSGYYLVSVKNGEAQNTQRVYIAQ